MTMGTKPASNAKPERNAEIYRLRIEGRVTLSALSKQFGVSEERIRYIVQREKRRVEGERLYLKG